MSLMSCVPNSSAGKAEMPSLQMFLYRLVQTGRRRRKGGEMTLREKDRAKVKEMSYSKEQEEWIWKTYLRERDLNKALSKVTI